MAISNIKINHQIQSEIIDIIKDAKDYCFVVSPYYQPWHQLVKALELAAVEEKRIFFLFRDDQHENRDIRALNEEFGFDVFFIKNLHAKLYLNEREGLISSMNLYDYSKENNFEIAYKITSSHEAREIAKSVILGEMLKVWATGCLRGRYIAELENDEFEPGRPKKKAISQAYNNANTHSNRHQEDAYCIRCRERIPGNVNKPYCQGDFQVWSQYQNYEYVESYCHRCGKPSETSMGKPLCYECFCAVNGALTM